MTLLVFVKSQYLLENLSFSQFVFILQLPFICVYGLRLFVLLSFVFRFLSNHSLLLPSNFDSHPILRFEQSHISGALSFRLCKFIELILTNSILLSVFISCFVNTHLLWSRDSKTLDFYDIWSHNQDFLAKRGRQSLISRSFIPSWSRGYSGC
jgi:hypothetical protein